jgi:hypothetical protein
LWRHKSGIGDFESIDMDGVSQSTLGCDKAICARWITSWPARLTGHPVLIVTAEIIK